ncbi:MAG: hypothetical protein HC886_02335 [Leptolyngbyaceae cyanobacterium SM1_1_3]|nr:hypothetical protein [Leptolyngbyaceae cyanobacterium SM1_1_3]NJN03687.1 hypothetical protein [Leptolyngbyaceae cyanobacterium RM1_1_2]NJO09149.1 hypothetical protein [Leptolyngbyaceae cyanobacterium SL_1_1]
MLEPLSLAAATVIAKIVLDKFYEGAGKELEETASNLGGAAVTQVSEKVQQIGKLVWQRCFRGKPGVDKRLESAAKGSKADLEVLQGYLETELTKTAEPDALFAEQVKKLAGELHQVIVKMEGVNAQNVQQNFDRQNTQVNAPNTNVYNVGDGSTVHFS